MQVFILAYITVFLLLYYSEKNVRVDLELYEQ